MVGFGVIGCGGVAKYKTIPKGILPAENSRPVAVMDVRKEISREVAKKFGAKYYVNEDDMFNDPEIDAVYIATPNYLHANQTIVAAKHNKHVLCEKPLAMSIKEGEGMISACRKNGVILQVGFMLRFHSCHRKALTIIEQGLIGEPVFSRAHWGIWYPEISGAWIQDPKMSGGGPLMDLGVHCIDLLRMFFGEVKEVSAFSDTLAFNYSVEDTSIVALHFNNRAYGLVDSFFNIPSRASKNELEIYGTKGSILIQGALGPEGTGTLRLCKQEEKSSHDSNQRSRIDVTEINTEPVNLYRAGVEHFVKCIKENRQPINSGYEAIRDLEVVLAAYESSKLGKTIKLLEPTKLAM